jgi:hypothetical protein
MQYGRRCHLRSFVTLGAVTAALLWPVGASGDSYSSWAAMHFTPSELQAGLGAPGADPDADLGPNLLEYFAGTVPDEGASSFRLQIGPAGEHPDPTVRFSFAPTNDGVDYAVLVSDDLLAWSEGALFVCGEEQLTYRLNGLAFARLSVFPRPGSMLDSDGDGLHDPFEESMVAETDADPFAHIGQILPDDDFDGDGIPNIDEDGNQPGGTTGSFSKPGIVEPEGVACAVNAAVPVDPPALVIHTPLR